jgi:hypothetical protein
MATWSQIFGNLTAQKEVHWERTVFRAGVSSERIFSPDARSDNSRSYSGKRNVADNDKSAWLALMAYVIGPNGAVFDPTAPTDTGEAASIADELNKIVVNTDILVYRGGTQIERHHATELLPMMPVRYSAISALWDQNNGSILDNGDKRRLTFVSPKNPDGLIYNEDIAHIELRYHYLLSPTSPLINSEILWVLAINKANTDAVNQIKAAGPVA